MKSVALFLLAAAVLLAREAASQPTAPTTSPENYDFIFSSPSDCAPSSCTIFAGVNLNLGDSNYVDIYLEGAAGGYVAVGFSASRNMFNADVVACTRDSSNNMVQALDTWNPSSGRMNQRDPTMEQDLMLFSGSFVNGRIRCSVAKRIVGSDSPQDVPLNTDLYILYAYLNTLSSPTALQNHGSSQRSVSLNTFPFPPIAATDPPPTTPTTEGPTTPTTEGPMTTAGTTPEPTTQAPPVAPVIQPEDSRLTFRVPAGCAPSECDIFVGIDTNTGNSDYLDIFLEAQANGYVAVGFSDTPDMFDADVVACTRNAANDEILALDTWNPSPFDRSNMVDTRSDVTLFSGEFVDGRIRCTVAKQIAADGDPRDIDLDAELNVIYARLPGDLNNGGAALANHMPDNRFIGPQVNPVQDEPTTQPTTPPPDSDTVTLTQPAGCARESCTVFVETNINPNDNTLLDITMEAAASGYVAVGFSNSQNMFSADVVVCVRDPSSGMIMALDAWNVASPGRNNMIDSPDSQDVELLNGTFINQRISCMVSKSIAPTDENDLNLDDDLFLMYARLAGDLPNFDPNNPSLVFHGGGSDNRDVTAARVNPVVGGGVGTGRTLRESLTRAHGILMLISWILLGVSGIFFAAWMRPALPNGEWFQIHRVFMVSSLIVGVVGFILIFIANMDSNGLILLGSDNPTGTAHFAIGIFVTALHIANPIISIFRCHPGDRFRWIFDLLHGTMIGLFAELFAITNCGIGLSLFAPDSAFNDLTVFWVYIGFVIFFMSLIVIMIFIFTVTSLFYNDGEERGSTAPSLIKPLLTHSSSEKAPPSSGGVELAVVGGGGDKSEPSEDKPKIPSKDAPLRWLFLGIFLVVLIPVMLALIVMVAI